MTARVWLLAKELRAGILAAKKYATGVYSPVPLEIESTFSSCLVTFVFIQIQKPMRWKRRNAELT